MKSRTTKNRHKFAGFDSRYKSNLRYRDCCIVSIFVCMKSYRFWYLPNKVISIQICKGQFKVKLGQIRSNFQIKKYKTCISYPVLSQDSKDVIYFYVRQLECQKVMSSHLPVFFFYQCTAKNEDIALKFGMCVVCN